MPRPPFATSKPVVAAEGGSTITQQLARQSFLSRDKTYRRKLKEVILAAYIEKMYDKNEILELYLNKVYFGGGLYGVEAASRGYFGKSSHDLTVDEAALLAGLIQSPSSYAPSVNLDRAVTRRNVVLQAMVSTGAIDQADGGSRAPRLRSSSSTASRSRNHPVSTSKSRSVANWSNGSDGSASTRAASASTRRWIPSCSVPPKRSSKRVSPTSSDGPAYKHPKRGSARATGEGTLPQYLQGALVAMDPTTGYVRAMVGGRDFDESRFNRATQAKRQSGSAFKPFVYAAALEAGYSPASVIDNLNAPIATPQGGWVPEDEHSSASSMTLRTALRTSSNRAAVQLLNGIGIKNAVGYAERLERRNAAERAVARARCERRDADRRSPRHTARSPIRASSVNRC